VVIREIRFYAHTQKFAKLYLFRDIYFIFAKIRGNSRNSFLRTHKHSRSFVFFAKFILFSRKFVIIREIHLYTHTESFVKLRLFREIFFIFAKNRGYSRNSSFHTHTNIREALSFSRNLFNFRENSWLFEKFVFSHTHKHSRSFVFLRNLFYFCENSW